MSTITLIEDLSWVELHADIDAWVEAYQATFGPILDLLFGWIFDLFSFFRVTLPPELKHYFAFTGIMSGAIVASIAQPPEYRLLGQSAYDTSTNRKALARMTFGSHLRGFAKRVLIGVPLYFPVAFVAAPFVLLLAGASALGFRNYFFPAARIMFDTVALTMGLVLLVLIVNAVLLRVDGTP